MKKLLLIVFTISAFLSCSKNFDEQNFEDDSLKLPELKKIDHITYQVISKTPFRIQSDQLKEIIVTLNGKQSYGYVHKDVAQEQTNEQPPISKAAVPGGWTIEWGHFFYAECLVYGALWTGNNGISLFVPCPINQCIGAAFAPICPPPGGGIAKSGN